MSALNKDVPIDSMENKEDSYATASSQLSGTQTFKNKHGHCVSAFPILVDFRRLIRLKATDSLLPGVINQDLLHAVVGLYDVSLSDLTPDVLYATVCEKWARTIILIRDLKELETEIKKKASVQKDLSHNDDSKVACSSAVHVAPSSDPVRVCEPADDIFTAEECSPSIFAPLYSDNEEDDDEEEEDEDEDGDFSIGIHSFIKTVQDRKKSQQKDPDTSCAHIGIEQRIVGCVTFEKKYLQSKERVVHLTLLSVRKKFQHRGIGKYLLSQFMDPSVAGFCDAVVVHADNAAADFFRRYAFSDDIILNSRWSELAEQFTNCTLMCYLPGFSVGDRLIDTKLPDTDISFADSDKDFQKWKTKSIEAYQAQVTCLTRLRHEVIHLRKLVGAQKGLINTLLAENEEIKRDKLNAERELLLRRGESSDIHQFRIGGEKHSYSRETGDTTAVTEGLQRPVKRLSVYKMDDQPIASYGATGFDDEPYDHAKDAAMFYRILNQFSKCMNQNRSGQQSNYEVKLISKAQLLESKVDGFRLRWRRGSNDSSQCAELYYCGSLQCPERIQQILNEGFSEKDFSHGDYGRGLYFSKHPDTAAQFSATGQLLLAEVIVHPEEKVTTKDRTRISCSAGYQALLTPGRLFNGNGDVGSACSEEFLIFDSNQVLPICALLYELVHDNLTES